MWATQRRALAAYSSWSSSSEQEGLDAMDMSGAGIVHARVAARCPRDRRGVQLPSRLHLISGTFEDVLCRLFPTMRRPHALFDASCLRRLAHERSAMRISRLARLADAARRSADELELRQSFGCRSYAARLRLIRLPPGARLLPASFRNLDRAAQALRVTVRSDDSLQTCSFRADVRRTWS